MHTRWGGQQAVTATVPHYPTPTATPAHPTGRQHGPVLVWLHCHCAAGHARNDRAPGHAHSAVPQSLVHFQRAAVKGMQVIHVTAAAAAACAAACACACACAQLPSGLCQHKQCIVCHPGQRHAHKAAFLCSAGEDAPPAPPPHAVNGAACSASAGCPGAIRAHHKVRQGAAEGGVVRGGREAPPIAQRKGARLGRMAGAGTGASCITGRSAGGGGNDSPCKAAAQRCA